MDTFFSGERIDAVRPGPFFINQVQNLGLLYPNQAVRNEPPVAAPPELFGAHVGRALHLGKREQCFDALPERFCLHVIGVGTEACGLQRDVRRIFSRALAVAAQGLAQPVVADARLWQRGFQVLSIEVRVSPGSREGAHIRQCFYLVPLQDCHKFIKCARRVPNRPDDHLHLPLRKMFLQYNVGARARELAL